MNDERQFYRDFEYGFYDYHNPALWQLQKETQTIRDKVRKVIGRNYELIEGNISLIGDTEEKTKLAAEEKTKIPAEEQETMIKPLTIDEQLLLVSWLRIKKEFAHSVINQSDKQFVLTADINVNHDDKNTIIPNTLRISNIKIGTESIDLGYKGSLEYKATGTTLKLTDELLYVLLAPNGTVLEQLFD